MDKRFFELNTTQLPEIEATDLALTALYNTDILKNQPDVDYTKFDALRSAVKAHFEITWTSIRPPMERLLYSIGAVNKPKNIVAIGIFCGNTLIWNTGSAVGPGKCFDSDHIVGVEIEKEPCDLAGRNLEKIGVRELVDLRCEDGHKTIESINYPIDLLYLDAFGTLPGGTEVTKLIYLSLLEKAYDKLSKGAVVVAHDTIIPTFLKQAQAYLDFVRDPNHFTTSASIVPDDQGVEISVK